MISDNPIAKRVPFLNSAPSNRYKQMYFIVKIELLTVIVSSGSCVRSDVTNGCVGGTRRYQKERSVFFRWLTNMSFGQKLVCQPIGRILFEWSKSVHKLLKYWSRKLKQWRAFKCARTMDQTASLCICFDAKLDEYSPDCKTDFIFGFSAFFYIEFMYGTIWKDIWTREWRNLPFAWMPSDVQRCYGAQYAPPIIFALSYKHDLWPKLSYTPYQCFASWMERIEVGIWSQ